MDKEEWIVRPKERKQLLMLKIPLGLVEKYGIKDKQRLSVIICGKNTKYFEGPLRVTSGQEIYLPKNVREAVEGETKLFLKILQNGEE